MRSQGCCYSEIPDGDRSTMRGDPNQEELSTLEVVHISCFPSALPGSVQYGHEYLTAPDLAHGPRVIAQQLSTVGDDSFGVFVSETQKLILKLRLCSPTCPETDGDPLPSDSQVLGLQV